MKSVRQHSGCVSREFSTPTSVALGLAALLMLVAASALAQQLPTFKVLYKFPSTGPSGIVGGLVRDPAGNLYGTTFYGGNSGCGGAGCGVVFEIAVNGTETVLYTFTGGTDGGNPGATLVRDVAGNLYGTTFVGGDLACSEDPPFGCGVVFELSPTGQETVLHSFTGVPDGAISGTGFPFAGLLRDSAGNLYGTTGSGGVNNAGTVFVLDASGNETVLYSFCSQGGSSCTDGAAPFAGLVRDPAGNLYGTTTAGGANRICGFEPCGTVFKLSPNGQETVVHNFAGYPTDGSYPAASLALDSAGNLYGTTTTGGSSSCGGLGCGTVFELSATGQETVLHSFDNGLDGGDPTAGLLRDRAGNLYGTTRTGGKHAAGSVFTLLSTGKEIVLFSFDQSDGSEPYAGLIRDSAGNLYGTTYNCGSFNCGGTVFEITH